MGNLLKEYISLILENKLKRAGAFEYDSKGLMLDKDGTMVPKDVREKIKKYFKDMKLIEK